jgi:polysaccharide export outer membrane protein
MTNIKIIFCGIASILFLFSCSEILEPVSFYGVKQNNIIGGEQEEFEIDIKSLTFKTAEKANNTPYQRQLAYAGSGSRANVLNEADFLKPNFPKSSSIPEYLLGVGDNLLYVQMSEFVTKTPQWPSNSEENEYRIGVGDELVFMQSNIIDMDILSLADENLLGSNDITKGKFIQTSGVVGTNGNILLFGLGNIKVLNQTLDSVRTTVRNMLISSGQAPNFQLEISKFQSKKAFVTVSNKSNKIVFLNNRPITLKELALGASISKSQRNYVQIKLTRNGKELYLTAGQLFDLSAPEIIIQDNDEIDIQIVSNISYNQDVIIGSKGNIFLPLLGIIPAAGLTINDLYEEISSLLVKNGLKPSFQLELTKFVSKKLSLSIEGVGSKIININNSNSTLSQLLLGSNFSSSVQPNSLTVVTLNRNGQSYQMTAEQIIDQNAPDIWVADDDHIEIKNLPYKPGQVFALSGAGSARMVLIDPSKRESLADILFTPNGVLNNLLAKRSEVYLLRGQNPSIAYHLDAQNVSRILVAAKTELRPNDIVYVADRPIISFSRLLGEISPLRVLLRDIQEGNIP